MRDEKEKASSTEGGGGEERHLPVTTRLVQKVAEGIMYVCIYESDDYSIGDRRCCKVPLRGVVGLKSRGVSQVKQGNTGAFYERYIPGTIAQARS